MDGSADSRTRRRLIALVTAGVVLLMLIGVGVYGLFFRDSGEDSPVPAEPAPSVTESQPDPRVTAPRPQTTAILPTRDAETFVHRVAAALFTWDTGSGLGPLDYTAVILDVGDPSGVEQAGLAADIAAYLPSRNAWKQLQPYSTKQWIEIKNASVPAAWAVALAQARPGQLPPGATAYTIDGTRQRDGMWNDKPVAVKESVSFTIFIACPDNDPCYLLRLSRLNDPLE